ncbi:protein phosphatase 2C [Angomonas deanei]|uniref:Protein phosphatase 2C, putative n=1 Tax=Angomonas deanei TaxID=59799 RepID=A0A7G2C3E0_9TRYP|nr:protein phosphatase 2C [Angomonas deanei]CAD2214216.1 Protein phosphatase 2C, putative [Angomonas deanei]|eukprot:EPY26441.1 protein phosphatase 2C [Angomonas deanei]
MTELRLTNKKMQRLVLPYMKVGICEMMNASPNFFSDSFMVYNTKNRLYKGDALKSSEQQFLGDVVGGGLCDSYTGREVSSHICQFLANALARHACSIDEIQKLRKEFGQEDPLVDYLLMAHRAKRLRPAEDRRLESTVSDKDMQQYAFLADASFFTNCKRGGYNGVEETGCRGVWFSSTVTPTSLEGQRRLAVHRTDKDARIGLAPPAVKSLSETTSSAYERELERVNEIESLYANSLDMVVSGVGDCRAFGICRNPLTDGCKRSQLDPTRERVIPLSVDHKPFRTDDFRRITAAGGVVDSSKSECIDDNPFLNVSRSFGHLSMKSNPKLSPIQQKLIPTPSSFTWEMLPGDVLVLFNHAVIETESGEDTTVDELGKLVGRGVDAGMPPEQIAGSLCDHALRKGATHTLQALVVVAENMREGTATAQEGPDVNEWIDAGPIYFDACKHHEPYRAALLRDCERCGVSLAELLQLRCERVAPLLPMRHSLSLLPYYSSEAAFAADDGERVCISFTMRC